ncbi:MAG: hypothetical protein IJD13_06700, partial [Oscillospiraceae bacterium]|nr:hypothetical protein [Oscillospiraceae bacterium]
MKIIYVPDYDTLSKKTAMEIAAQLIQKPDSILGKAEVLAAAAEYVDAETLQEAEAIADEWVFNVLSEAVVMAEEVRAEVMA